MRRTAAAGGDRRAGARDEAPDTAETTISEEEGRELLQSIVDFTETVVREVMTPRPDIVAIRAGCVASGSPRAVPGRAVLAHARLS